MRILARSVGSTDTRPFFCFIVDLLIQAGKKVGMIDLQDEEGKVHHLLLPVRCDAS